MSIPILLRLLLTAAVSYCCGNLNGAIIVSRAKYKTDVRDQGSGNAGLTNFYRVYGPAKMTLVILIDISKAIVAVLTGGMLLHEFGIDKIGQLFALLFVIAGHMFPVTFDFRGGKGVLATLGALFVIDWRIGSAMLLLMILIVAVTRYISLASVLMSVLLPILLWIFTHDLSAMLLACCCSVLIIYMHRSNIKRLLQGTESKFCFPWEKKA